MIFINLLPHREAARKRKREAFQLMLGVSVLAGALLAGGVFLWYEAQISDQQDRLNTLKRANDKLDTQIKDIAGLRAEIAALRARQQAVEDLQSDRNLPVHMLNELTRQLPEGVYITSVKQENQTIALQGMAQSNERISELLRNLANNTPWLARPDLVDIVGDNVAVAPRDVRRVAKFNIKVKLVRSSEVKKPGVPVVGAAASAPAGAASARPGVLPVPAASAQAKP